MQVGVGRLSVLFFGRSFVAGRITISGLLDRGKWVWVFHSLRVCCVRAGRRDGKGRSKVRSFLFNLLFDTVLSPSLCVDAMVRRSLPMMAQVEEVWILFRLRLLS